MSKVIWGILGCGNVAEIKSGPAFQTTTCSELRAVMRRNSKKAKDFAKRHHVPFWYDKAEDLLKDPKINAVYIASPPASHLELTLKAIKAGKNIYLEKPMALNQDEAKIILEALKNSSVKLTLAHYRRRLPAFIKVKKLLEEEVIGSIRFVDIQILQPSRSEIVAKTEKDWRLNPSISGGGYFHDLAPHQIDLMYFFFGNFNSAEGISLNQGRQYGADDIVNGIASFENGIQLRAVWCFNVAADNQKDQCIIYGSKGYIKFSFFGEVVTLNLGNKSENFLFDSLSHIQQPMIKATVDYFTGKSANPCTGEEGLVTMEILDKFAGII
ncbi:Gfo/Idh/MocA family oxidoreductase [Salegentibacter sp. BDJ18]|uniref:Gfo/Idh/MocA family protein n=1 Tax=Salegentibacter sp. BDJ18 TaxID=2816376 RepID=UPI001AAFFB63|nr:Gfo/Idh/MocA family oxidoreductase [Salegentibacter sp. BDJ18]MBO2543172.1 Gfo/Idh/MocA family oxidoreductase [Salegentibacter sp. BDJ18]